MNKGTLSILSITTLVWLTNGCRKDHKSDPSPLSPPSYKGTFVATVDGNTWKASNFSADYYPLWHQLYISADDKTFQIIAGINIDSNNLLKKYSLEPNGENEAIWDRYGGGDKYYSSHDMTDAGGSFNLQKFDTSKMLISGSLQFTGYSADRLKRIVFSSTEITDMPYKIYSFNYSGNSAICTVVGAKTTVWHCKDIYPKIICTVDSKKTLEVNLGSIIGPAPGDRYIGFRIPLEVGTGSFPVYPQLTTDDYCHDRKVTSLYKIGRITYFPTPGNLKITYLDAALKKLAAEFTLTYKDDKTQTAIQIANCQINLNTWDN